jgi:hypothetical protein
MRRFFLVILSVFLSFAILFSQASAQDVKVLKKGDPAPFDGVLFTKELEKSIRTDIQVYEKKIETYDKLNKLNEMEIDILSKRLSLYQEKTNELLQKEDNSNLLKNTIVFLSGVVITGLLVHGTR